MSSNDCKVQSCKDELENTDKEMISDDMQSHKGNKLPLSEDYGNCKKMKKDIQFSSDESEELSHISFMMLPDEIIINILQNVDRKSLCRMSQVNTRLHSLSSDVQLYRSLKVRDIYYSCWQSNFREIFAYYAPLCKEALNLLDLSFCHFPVSEFYAFLNTCGKNLTHLRLRYCESVRDNTLFEISKNCKNLKELDLSNCNSVSNTGLLYLVGLKYLECLNLQKVKRVKTRTLRIILRKNRQMRDLNLAYMKSNLNMDTIAKELMNSCQNLEKLNVRSAHNLTSKGIAALAQCKNLRELNLGLIRSGAEKPQENCRSLRKLFSSCHRLEIVDLSWFIKLKDHELRTLTTCKNLKELYLSGLKCLTPNTCIQFFNECRNLKKIDLSFCRQITDSLVDEWNELYQPITIYKFYSSILMEDIMYEFERKDPY